VIKPYKCPVCEGMCVVTIIPAEKSPPTTAVSMPPPSEQACPTWKGDGVIWGPPSARELEEDDRRVLAIRGRGLLQDP
jgi:hypothetical protein